LPEESQTGPLASSNLYHAASPSCGCPAGHWPELEDEPALDDEAPVDDEEALVLADAALDDDVAPVPLDTTALLELPAAPVEAGAPPCPPVPAAHAAGSSARAATAMRSIRLGVKAGAIEPWSRSREPPSSGRDLGVRPRGVGDGPAGSDRTGVRSQGGGAPKEVSVVLSGPTVPAPGRVRFPPAELLLTWPSARSCATMPARLRIPPAAMRAPVIRPTRSICVRVCDDGVTVR
jgi:hypothetical protein